MRGRSITVPLHTWHMTNDYLTDSDEEATTKANEHFKDKVSKEYLLQEFARSHKLSVKVCKTWLDSERTCYRKLTHLNPVQALTGYDLTSELDTGQATIPEFTHQMQGAQQVVSLHITSARS